MEVKEPRDLRALAEKYIREHYGEFPLDVKMVETEKRNDDTWYVVVDFKGRKNRYTASLVVDASDGKLRKFKQTWKGRE